MNVPSDSSETIGKVLESTPKKATGVFKETEQEGSPSFLGSAKNGRNFLKVPFTTRSIFFEKRKWLTSVTLCAATDVDSSKGSISTWSRLEKYLPEDYGVAEDETTIHLNNQAFSRNLLSLFKTLSEWQGCGGLSLKLSASSPSDTLHAWPNFRLKNLDVNNLHDLNGTTPRRRERVEQICQRNHGRVQMRTTVRNLLDFGLSDKDDPQRLQSIDRRSLDHGREHTQRTFGNLLDFVLPDNDDLQFLNSAKIPAVSRFAISLQHHRTPSPQALEYIIGMLPNVEELVYQPWRGMDQRHNELLGLAYWTLLTEMPKEVKRVSLWEESHPWMHTGADAPDIFDIATAAAKASRQLETLYATCVFDALDFFLSAGPQPWPELRHLALTSPRVGASVKYTRANKLLHLAARAASRMPKLELMELWHCEENKHQFFFRYERRGKTAKMTIESSWEFRMDKETNTKWTETTRNLGIHLSPTILHIDLVVPSRTPLENKDRLRGRVCWPYEGNEKERKQWTRDRALTQGEWYHSYDVPFYDLYYV
ncbi:hypothetical protein K456DRAFT_36059 [Colletotrichum gloeosporioides 23]|nr:hypothetical protein K456DRAFT_36059 [Colletotrichum gloeosporioides 23]